MNVVDTINHQSKTHHLDQLLFNWDQHQTNCNGLTLSCPLLAAVESAVAGVRAGTNGRFGVDQPPTTGGFHSHQLKNWGCATSLSSLTNWDRQKVMRVWKKMNSCYWMLKIGLHGCGEHNIKSIKSPIEVWKEPWDTRRPFVIPSPFSISRKVQRLMLSLLSSKWWQLRQR